MAKLGLQQSPLEAALQQAESVSYGLPDDLKKQFEQDRIKAESRRKNTDQQYDARVLDLSSRNAAVTGGATWDSKLDGAIGYYKNNPGAFKGLSEQELPWALAIMAQESRGVSNAVSPVGARGLMQHMPVSRQQVLNTHGFDVYASDANNIKGGVIEFNRRLKMFNGDVDKALAAYNAGEGNVDKAVARARKYGGDWKAYLPRPQETIPYINNVKGYYNAIGSKGGVPTSAAQPAPTKQATTADSRYRPLSETELKRMQEAQAQGLDTFVPFAGAKPIKIGQQPGKKAPKQENEDAGFLSDTGNLLLSGVNSSVEAAHEIAGRMPGISIGAAALDKIQEYFTGKTPQQIFKEVDEKYNKKLSNETAAARKKRWIIEPGDDLGNGKKATEYSFGDAWKDPRAYYAGIVESAPEMVTTMGGSMTLAKGAFKAALKSGATREVASKKAATTATIAGGILEGGFGGAHAAIDVRKEIKGMSADILKNSEAMKALMAEGKTFEQARNQLAEDAATKAFVVAGVGTGIFGGMGDRAIAQVITKGTSSRLKSAVGGAIGEGLLEEAPQSAAQQMAQNYALQDADPNRSLMKGVANQAAGGAVLGGIMGGGIGAAAHRADVPQVDQPVAETPQAEEVPQTATEAPVQDAVPEQPIQPEQPPRKVGPLERALGGEESLNTAIDNEIAAVAADQWLGAPGTVTKISPKADPESVYTVTVEGYENGEVFARDQDGTPMQFSQGDVNVAQLTSETITPAGEQDNQSPELTDFGYSPTKPAKAAEDPNLSTFDTTEGQSVNPEPVKTVEIEQPEKTLGKMSEDELRARVKYLADQAKLNGGWDKRLMGERRKVEDAIGKLSKKQQAVEETQEAPAVEQNDAEATKMPSFDELFLDAHINNPAQKTRLIQAEIKNSGRTRSQVLADVKRIVDAYEAGKTEVQAEETPKTHPLQAKMNDAVQRYNDAVDARNQANEQGFFDEAKRQEQIALSADKEVKAIKRQYIADVQESTLKAEQKKVENIANEYLSKPIGSRYRPSEYEEERGLYWEKTASNEWTGRGDWFQKGKTRTNIDMAKAGGLIEVPSNAAPVTIEATTDMPAPLMGADGNPKWFMSQDKAQAHIEKKKLVGQYEVKQVDSRRFEIHPIAAATQDTAPSNAAPSVVEMAAEQPAATTPKTEATEKTEATQADQRPTLPKVYNVGPFTGKTTPIGKTVYREMDADGLYDLTRNTLTNGGGNTSQLYVADNIDLAMGQGANKGILVQMRGDAVSGKENYKPGTGDIAGREYVTDFIGMDAIDQILIQKDTKLRPMTRQLIQTRFDRQNLDDGSILFTRKGVDMGQTLNEMLLTDTPTPKAKPAKQTTHSVDQWRNDMNEALAKADPEHPQFKKLQLNAKYGLKSENDREVALRQAREIEKKAEAPKAKAEPEQPKVEANEQRESKIQSFINKWNQLKENGTASELDNFHKTVKIALNGYAQGKGVVTEFEQLKADIENFAKDYNKLPKTEQSTNSGPSAAETSTEQPAPKSKPSDFIQVISVGDKKAPTPENLVEKLAPQQPSEIEQGVTLKSKTTKFGALNSMSRPVEINFSLQNAESSVFLARIVAQPTISDAVKLIRDYERSNILKQIGTTQFKVRVDINTTENKGGHWGYLEISPRKGYTLIKAAIDVGKVNQAPVALGETSTPNQKPTDQQSVHSAEPATVEQKTDQNAGQFADNKLFTADKVAAARARLKSKFGRLNSGIDPEVLIDGMTIAGAYIESGVRKFSDYSKAMIEDLGDGVKPYLLSFWEGARNYPGLDTTGMTSVEDSAKEHAALLTPADVQTEAVGQIADKPKTRTKKTGAKGDMVLTQDWGVEHIDGYSQSNDREIGNDTKDAFLKETRNYLNAVADALRTYGFEPHLDSKGKPEKPVNVNESGMAGSGDVSLVMQNPDNGNNVYITIGDTSLRGVVPTTPSGIAIMYRVGQNGDRYATRGTNTWSPVDLSANDLAKLVNSRVRPITTTEESQNARTVQSKELSAGDQGGTQTNAAAGNRDSEQVATGVAEASQGADRGEPVSSSTQGAGRSGTGSVQRGNEPASSTSRNSGNVRTERGTADAVADPELLRIRAREEYLKKQSDTFKSKYPLERVLDIFGKQNDYYISNDSDYARGFDVDGEQYFLNYKGTEIRIFKVAGYEASDYLRPSSLMDKAPFVRYDLPVFVNGKRPNIFEWARQQLANTQADPATAETSPKPEIDQPTDFDLSSEDIGNGGLTKKYKDNIAAIQILKAMESENRVATPEERKQIARYVGWGALKGVFDKDNKQWAKEYTELKGLLTDAEYKAARASTLNAHYTSPTVVGGIFKALEQMGFTSGRVLEPSVGTGNFFGLMPASMRKKSQLHGVELDPLTSQIAAALYPSAKIAKATGFQDFQIPSEYFDLAIGNPPFGSEPIVDNDRSPYSGSSIHNYFFAKSIDKLRPGGLLTMVVSHNFMDANNDATRKWISERADLVSAVRLPRTAFKENAGTDVVTDILVFRKRAAADGAGDASWVKTGTQKLNDPKTGNEVEHRVSSYFLNNPQNVLGTPSAAGSMYRAAEYTVEPNGDLGKQLSDWAGTIPANMYQPIERTHEKEAANVTVPDGVKVGSYFVGDNGAIQMRGPDSMGNRTATEWTAPNAKAAERMKGMIGLRDALREQMRLEKSPETTEKQIEDNRAELNRLYDDFRKDYGFLNDQTNRRIFLDDTESALLLALEFDYDKGVSKAVAAREEIDARAPSAVKADIFNRRVMFPPADNIKVSNANDALLASLNYKARLDLPYMASLYDKTEVEIIQELGDVVFNDPINGYVMADEYLSGDVKTKLAEAQEAAKDNPEFKRNVDALKKVIPADKLPSEIHAALGASFIPNDLYEQFAKELTGANHKVAYVRATGQWVINASGMPDATLNLGKWGIAKMPAVSIFARTMAGQGVVVTETVSLGYGKTETRVLEKETEAAREKQAAIKAEWQRWLWSDPDRADRVASIYNEKMNRIVVRKYDGSHMTFPGMSPAINLLEHQKNAVWRALQSRQVLLDHTVGAGKTFEIVALFMEMRRLGIARKPFIAVPNHLTLQWRSEFSRLYPGANVLAATPEDFSKGNREKFFSKIVTGDWDAVIVGHSSLKKIALPVETEKAVLEEQISEIAEAIEQLKRERGDRNIIRDMEGIRARLDARMKQRIQALGERDKVVTFDELGVDAFAIDELHEFKNLFYNSTMERVPGMGNPSGSDKAFDLFVKLQWMFNTFGDKAPIAGATGTPVSNSLVEMFNMQRLLQYPSLKKDGLHVFDAWAKQFGSVESLYEVSPSGTGYRQSSRFAKFKNLPALMAQYQTFADTVTLDDLKAQEEAQGKAFPVPKVFGGRPQNIVAKRSPEVASFMGTPQLDIQDDRVQFGFNVAAGDQFEIKKSEQGDHFNVTVTENIDGAEIKQHIGTAKTEEDARLMLVEQALSPKIYVDPKSILGQFANLKELNKKTKGKVNALSLTGLANKAGLDYRLIDPNAPDFAGSKINMAVDRMMATYKKWDADKGTQLVFCDLSVPKSARSGYGAKERRAYVRDEKGALTHKKATLHTAEGFEDLPFLVVKEAKTFVIYDAATGLRIRGDLPSKAVAVEWSKETLSDDAKRQRWIDARDSIGDLDQDAIDDYNNANEIDTEETEAISLIDIAGASGAADFSVYDDIKAKLIAKGVPEREIAFIHDYSTPVAKEKLFKAVNAGTIRFLIGSTPKMGAGTNVQKRLVGLHHIDAPWRPSDLEQREGRIIRRGNTLYERDPSGFEVEIYRYATEQTYDTRRWQILEHKSRGIEQLRNYDGTTNEIDDIEGEAANAADMKAAASGDPLILEETQLRNDVRRLESLQAAHADSTQMMFRRARDNQRFADEVGPRALEEHQKLLATAEMYPVKKDQFVGVTVEGRSFTDRDEAVKAIQKQLVRVFSGERDATFNYRGIEFTIENTLGYVELNSPTGRLDSFDPSKDSVPSAAGFLTRFANYINRLPAHIDDLNAKIAEAKQSAVDMREQANAPFAQADELTAAREAHKSVQRRLIAKGPDIPAKQKPLLDKAMEEQRKALRDAGLGDAMDEFIGSRQNSRGQASNTGTTVEQVRDTLSDRFGAKTIAKLEKAGLLTIVDTYNEAGVEGFAQGRKVTLVADALTAESIVPVFLHELGGHVGFQGVMKPTAYKNLMEQFDKLVAAKDPIALEAKRLAEREIDPETQEVEYLPYLITVAARQQNNRPGIRTLINRIIAAVKAWAVDKYGVNLNLNANDVLALAERMVNTIGKGDGAGQRRYSRADQTETPEFKKWFGDSKVVDENGKPLVVYHGTTSEFTQFDESKLKQSTGHKSSDLGFFFTADSGIAALFAGQYMDEGTWPRQTAYKAGSNIMPVYLSIKNPLEIPAREFAARFVRELEDAEKFRNEAIEKGHDGLRITGDENLGDSMGGDEYAADAWVAFTNTQVKSATGNTGTFDANNPDIRFSRRDEDLAPVSEQEYASKLSQWWSEAKKLPSDKLTKLMTDGGLGLIPLRPMLTEMAKDIPAATSYLRIKDAMDAMRNKWHAKTDAVAQEWLKYRIKNKEENRELMDLMHESTLNQVDPSMPFQSLMTPKERMALANPSLNANLRLELTAKMELDAKREEAYDVLKSRYDSLSSEAQSLYKSVRDTYTDLADAFDETLLNNMEKAINVRVKKAEREHSREMERITDEGLQGQERDDAIAAADRRLKNAKTKIAWNRKARMTQLRKQFETQRLAGPYFPLARFGNLFVTVRDAKSGEVVSFSRFEDPTEQRQFAEEMRKDKNYKVEEGALIGEAAVRKAVDPNFVADVEDILADLPNAEQVKDEVWQRYLESLPDMSVRKSRIHRKGRAGFNADAVRAFGHHMFHGSHQLARMAHSMDLEDALDQAKDDARTSKDPKRSSLIVNEMEKRHQFIMNPTGGALAQWASSFAFVWYLAGSPKAAIMNLFQTPIMATPILGAYAGGLNGVARAGKELIKAAIDFTKGKGFAGHSSSLTAEERQAMADGYETGVIERTQGHDLAGVGETGVEYSAARERAMKIISWGFHHAERMNREVTFLAAYRLARTKGLSHESAVNKAGELTWKSHFDYSNTSRPRLMHSDTMKVLLVFRNFQINMLYRLFRDVHQAVNGESKEVRREALTHLAGITGMMMLNAGITGTWLFGIAMVMAGLFMDDGEDPDEELKKAMIKVLGPRLAGMALHGLPGYITGTSLSGSVGMPDLWFRSPDSEKEGEEALQYWQSQLLGAVPGIAAQFVSGWDKIKKGEEYRGIETMMPKMFKDPMKAYRYMTEGAKNMRGDTVAEVTNPDVIKQALGFTPARIAEQYKINNASYNLQQSIMKERKRIMDDYYKADQEGDEAKVNELIKKIEKYNEKNPEQAITPRSIIQSRKNRDKGAENAVGGMRYNSKLRDRLMEEQAPTIYGE